MQRIGQPPTDVLEQGHVEIVVVFGGVTGPAALVAGALFVLGLEIEAGRHRPRHRLAGAQG